MHDDDCFNDSDEIYNLYSSKKVTQTFETRFKKLISSNSSSKNGTTKSDGNEGKEAKKQPEADIEICELVNEASPVRRRGKVKEKPRRPVEVKSASVIDDSIEIVSDSELEGSVEVVEHCASQRVTRQSARLRNKRSRSVSSLNDSDADSQINSQFVRNTSRGKRKQRRKSIDEIILIDSPQAESLEEDELNPEISVKVIWKSVNIKKYKVRKFQKLAKIFEEISKEENIPENKIMLTFNNVKVNRNETPDSLNLQVYHFLDGGVLSELTNSCDTSNFTNSDENAVIVKFQDVNKKIIKVSLGKKEKLKIGMIKCSEQLEIELDKIKFFFDGELLDPMETPSSLGLENDEVIDIKICK